MKYKIVNIEYDTDNVEIDLPTEMVIDVPTVLKSDYERVEFISDEISNRTGFCHLGFQTEPKLNE